MKLNVKSEKERKTIFSLCKSIRLVSVKGHGIINARNTARQPYRRRCGTSQFEATTIKERDEKHAE